jgi:hypothetical protein
LFATLFGFKKYNAVNPCFDDTTCQRRAGVCRCYKRVIQPLNSMGRRALLQTIFNSCMIGLLMIKDGKAYIDSQSSEDMAKQKEQHSLVLMDLTVIVLYKRILLYLKE